MKTKLQAVVFACLTVFGSFVFAQTENAKTNPLEGDMLEIPAGHFIFGTDVKDETSEALSLGIPKPWAADEGPEQKIFLKGFYLDRYEVTHNRYKIYLQDVGAVPPKNWQGKEFPSGKGDHPVTEVTWFDASNFCGWAEKTLPTEKQWERAARGKTGGLYPWGNEFDLVRANLSRKAGSKNAAGAVGSSPEGASPEGVHDLIGNVWEWVQNDYAPYNDSSYKSADYGAGLKVLRGHSARDIGHFPGATYLSAMKQFARSGYRQSLSPDDTAPDVGFRCASSEKPAAMKAGGALTLKNQPAGGSPFDSASGPAEKTPGNGEVASSTFSGDNPFAAKSNLPDSGMIVLTLLAFVAGVFSFLSPCTLPILPAYFAITAQTERARMSLMSFGFFLGLASLFVLMGASASFVGGLLRDYLFSITTWAGVLVAVFGVMTLFGWGFSGASFKGKPGSSFLGFYLFGATFALGWTPCVGPILSGILLLAASDKTIFQGMTLLFFYAIGLGLPLMVISTFCGNLPKDGLFWRTLRGKGWDVKIAGRTIFLHTTNIFSGLLLIVLGVALSMGMLTYINSLIPIELQIWFSEFEEKFLSWFM